MKIILQMDLVSVNQHAIKRTCHVPKFVWVICDFLIFFVGYKRNYSSHFLQVKSVLITSLLLIDFRKPGQAIRCTNSYQILRVYCTAAYVIGWRWVQKPDHLLCANQRACSAVTRVRGFALSDAPSRVAMLYGNSTVCKIKENTLAINGTNIFSTSTMWYGNSNHHTYPYVLLLSSIQNSLNRKKHELHMKHMNCTAISEKFYKNS
jgi:hypothetical protein